VTATGTRCPGEEGAVVILELLMWTAVLALVLGAVALSARHPLVQSQLDRAAKAAAEEAAAHRSKPAALDAARTAARANLERDGVTCLRLSVDLDLSDWRPGGIIRADVRCDVDLSDLVALSVPVEVHVGMPMSSWFLATIDTHKALS
jgi:hypothetical protein